MVCASSGDSLDDANFTTETANAAILQLSTIEMYFSKVAENFKSYRSPAEEDKKLEYFDNIFLNKIYLTALNTLHSYEDMRYRDVVKHVFYEMTAIKDSYLISCSNRPRQDLLKQYLFWQLLLIYPICPHFG